MFLTAWKICSEHFESTGIFCFLKLRNKRTSTTINAGEIRLTQVCGKNGKLSKEYKTALTFRIPWHIVKLRGTIFFFLFCIGRNRLQDAVSFALERL
jgi:hypothetical protein